MIHLSDALEYLSQIESRKYRLAYVDPPFNTGKVQRGRAGSYTDSLGESFIPWLTDLMAQIHRTITDDGSVFIHLDWREVHRAKVLVMDEIFGATSFMNEIIWAYDYGARSRKKWSTKHDSILWYVKDPKNYVFNFEEMDRIPYMAPGLVGPEKAARGKTPTDVWWHTIVPTNGKERTGYPTQKPLGILNRILKVHSLPGDQVLDPCAGSGSFGEAALALGRFPTLVDSNPEAIAVMEQRLKR